MDLIAARCSLLALAVLSTTGCVAAESGPMVVTFDAVQEVQPQALLFGTLTPVDDCIALNTAEGVFTVVFPSGSHLVAGGSGVEVPGSGELKIGKPLNGASGGFSPLSNVVDSTNIPSGCLTDTVVVLVAAEG